MGVAVRPPYLQAPLDCVSTSGFVYSLNLTVMLTQEKAGNLLPTVFNYSAKKKLRAIYQGDHPWVALSDLCKVLGLSNPSNVVLKLSEDERAKFFLGRQGETWFVNESGIYTLIFRSNKPEAKAFRKWVTNDVLPAIRRTGSYGGLLLPSRIHGRDVNGRKVYPFAKLAKSLGYTSGGSLYYRRKIYPNHFIKLDRKWYASEEMKQLMQMSRSASVHRDAIKTMQPILALDFGEPLLLKGGAQ